MLLRLLALGALAAVACGGDTDLCPGKPAAPEILAPLTGRIDVTAADLRIDASPYVNSFPDPHVESQFEIWIVDDDGDHRERVWTASVTDPARLTSVTIADGAFEGIGLPDATLFQWTDHIVRARYRDSCGA